MIFLILIIRYIKKFDPDNNYSLEYLLLKYYDTEIVDKIKYFSGANN